MDQAVVSTSAGVFLIDVDSGNLSAQLNDSNGSVICPVGTTSQGGVTGSRIICSVQSAKALLHYWKLNASSGAPESSGNPVYKCSAPEKFSALAFSSCGGLMFAGTFTGTIYCWQTWTGLLLCSWPGHFGPITALRLSADDTHLYTASEDTLVKVYFLPDVFGSESPVPHPSVTISAHSGKINDLAVTGDTVVTCSGDMWVKSFKVERGKHTQLDSVQLQAEPSKVALSNTGSHVFIGCVDGSVHTLSNGTLSSMTGKHKGPVTGLGLSLDCSRVVTCGVDGVAIWDALSRMQVQFVAGNNGQLKNSLSLFVIRKPLVFVPEFVQERVRDMIPSGERRLVSAIDSFLQFKPLQRTLTAVETIDVIPLIHTVVSSANPTTTKVRNGICINSESVEGDASAWGTKDESLAQQLEEQKQITRMWVSTCSDLYERLSTFTEGYVELKLPVFGAGGEDEGGEGGKGGEKKKQKKR